MNKSATATKPLPKREKLYQKRGVDELFCPVCAADVVRDGCRFTCKCGASWSVFFGVYVPSAMKRVRAGHYKKIGVKEKP